MEFALSLTARARRSPSRMHFGWRWSPLNTRSTRILSRKFNVIMKGQPRSNPRSTRNQRTVSVIGTGSYAPDKILTNEDLSHIVDTSDEWIVTRTGIKERRMAAKD